MSNPVLALIWQCWRLSRRWYLALMMLSFFFGWLIFYSSAPPVFDDPRNIILNRSNPTFAIIIGIACFSTLLLISVGKKNGFPFTFEQRLPINTFTLIAVPMVFLGLLCASLSFIPLGFFGLLLDIPYPLLPGTIIVFCFSFAVLCCGWITTNNIARSIAIIAAVLLCAGLFYWFEPLNLVSVYYRSRGVAPFNSDIISLDSLEYLELSVITVILFATTVYVVGSHRNGETTGLFAGNSVNGKAARPGSAKGNSRFSISSLLENITDKVTVVCPVGRPWQAEVWCEFKRYTIPVLSYSLALALLIPLMLLFGSLANFVLVMHIAGLSPLTIYFVAIGMSLLNRRKATDGYMNVFEGTRGMTTLQLMGIQIGVTALSIFIGIALASASLSLSDFLAGDFRGSYFSIVNLLPLDSETSLLMTMSNRVLPVFLFFTVITMFICFHSFAIFWGRKFLGLTAALALNGCLAIVTLGRGVFSVQILHVVMWVFSLAVAGVTLAGLLRILRLQVIAIGGAGVMLLGWTVFAVCGYAKLEQVGFNFSGMDTHFLAFNVALLLLPLTFAVLTLWSYDRLRHT